MVDTDRGPWRLTGFHGMPERSRRRESWALLRTLHQASDLPWLCLRDFNDMLYSSDKKGRHEHPEWLYQGFRDVMDYELIDISLEGYPFTWERGRCINQSVEERTYQALVSSSWLVAFPQARLVNLTAHVSDHSPLLLIPIELSQKQKMRKKFCFENGWLTEPVLKKVVQCSWVHSTGLFLDKLQSCAHSLYLWGGDLAMRLRKGIIYMPVKDGETPF